MISGMLLFAIYFLRALWIWRSAPAPLTEFEQNSEEITYRYATTPVRHWLVKLGSCLLFAAIASFLSYAVGFLLWSSFLFNWAGREGLLNLAFFILLALFIVGLTCTPKVRQLLTEACLFFQRYQFFPPLPSRREESLIEQLERLPAGTLPTEVSRILKAGSDAEPADAINRLFLKLESVHGALSRIAQSNHVVTRRLYFRAEWELIDNQYQVIAKHMHSNESNANGLLLHKTSTCLYYAYNLLTRYIVETSASSWEIQERFRACGFDVRL